MQIRRLKIQDALVQMEFSDKKGAKFIKQVCRGQQKSTEFLFCVYRVQVLEDTQEKAVKSHFVSDPNNLYVGQWSNHLKIY